uniref:Uncharacterized protein n=1 Tax=Corvus moneduloides TaxID=1196302 RepID=A0A8C3DTF9_CORMO
MWEELWGQLHPEKAPAHLHRGEALRVPRVREELRALLQLHPPAECPALDSASPCRALHSQSLPVPPQTLSIPSTRSQSIPRPLPDLHPLSQCLPLHFQALSVLHQPYTLPLSMPHQLIPVSHSSLPVPPSMSISLVPLSSQPSPRHVLCSEMDFYPSEIQVRWFQGQQELSGHVVATDIVPNGDWTHQLLVLLEIPPGQPLSQHWGMARPPQRWGELGRGLEGLGRELGCAGRSGRAGKGFEGCWGGWDGATGVLMDTGRECGGAGCNWEGV